MNESAIFVTWIFGIFPNKKIGELTEALKIILALGRKQQVYCNQYHFFQILHY